MRLFWKKSAALAFGLFVGPFAVATWADDDVPANLPGVTVISAQQTRAMGNGVRLIDTRVLHDYLAGHIPGAFLAHYKERSARVVDFDPAQDDVPGFLARLRKFAPEKHTPLVFYCNGVACWKSYKGAHAALKNGYRRVYWFRGGMAEWQAQNLPTVSE